MRTFHELQERFGQTTLRLPYIYEAHNHDYGMRPVTLSIYIPDWTPVKLSQAFAAPYQRLNSVSVNIIRVMDVPDSHVAREWLQHKPNKESVCRIIPQD